jgi:hypothetical protein
MNLSDEEMVKANDTLNATRWNRYARQAEKIRKKLTPGPKHRKPDEVDDNNTTQKDNSLKSTVTPLVNNTNLHTNQENKRDLFRNDILNNKSIRNFPLIPTEVITRTIDEDTSANNSPITHFADYQEHDPHYDRENRPFVESSTVPLSSRNSTTFPSSNSSKRSSAHTKPLNTAAPSNDHSSVHSSSHSSVSSILSITTHHTGMSARWNKKMNEMKLKNAINIISRSESRTEYNKLMHSRRNLETAALFDQNSKVTDEERKRVNRLLNDRIDMRDRVIMEQKVMIQQLTEQVETLSRQSEQLFIPNEVKVKDVKEERRDDDDYSEKSKTNDNDNNSNGNGNDYICDDNGDDNDDAQERRDNERVLNDNNIGRDNKASSKVDIEDDHCDDDERAERNCFEHDIKNDHSGRDRKVHFEEYSKDDDYFGDDYISDVHFGDDERAERKCSISSSSSNYTNERKRTMEILTVFDVGI